MLFVFKIKLDNMAMAIIAFIDQRLCSPNYMRSCVRVCVWYAQLAKLSNAKFRKIGQSIRIDD